MSEMNGMTRKLAEFLVRTDQATIPAEMFEHAKVAFLDFLAVTYGGKDDPLVDKLIAYAELMGGKEQASLIGQGMKRSMEQAALINGAASHALDYDDTLVSFLGHPSVTIFPSLLALSQVRGKSGRDFLGAYLIGLQVGGTIGACAGLDHYLAGWHATSTLGHLASAAACARLIGLNEQQSLYALGIAATMSSGLKRNFGTMVKPFHAGRAAAGGLMAALLAESGFTAAEDALEGPQGFFECLKGKVNEQILGFLGLGWDVVNLSQKYHASCHATHSPLEAAREIVAENKIAISDIEKIVVHSSEVTMQAAKNPDPKTGLEGKFSVPFCVANALLQENTGMAAFTDERVNDPAVRALVKKISVVKDPAKTALEATVEITVKGGKTFTGFSDILQKIPPLEKKQANVRVKFQDMASAVVGAARAEELARKVDGLLENPDISAL
ncbi:MAG: MmgE/PrpD family protein, partial [Thermodesulfobacteriota bacterium]